jgi:hypothetical protein
MPKTRSRKPPGDAPAGEAHEALAAVLEPGEPIERDVAAIGAHLLLTDRRLVMVRDGFTYRPVSGIRSWPLDRQLELRLTPGQLLIEVRGAVVGVFFHEPQSEAIRSLVAAIRRRTSTLRAPAPE